MSKLNYRSKYKVIDIVELKPLDVQGSSRIILSGNERRNGIQFEDYQATDVYLRDESMLEQLEQDNAIKSIGEVKEIGYQNIDELIKKL